MSHHNGQASKCDWRTPERLLAPAREVCGGRIALDPCTSPDNPTKALRFFTEEDDGLAQDWGQPASIFANIPWSKKLGIQPKTWLAPLYRYALGSPSCHVIIVTAASTNSRWFHDYLSPGDAHCFPRGRVEHDRPPGEEKTKNGVSFDTLITYFGPSPALFRQAYRDVGWCPEYAS